MLALCLAIFIPVTAIVLTMVAVLPSLGAPPLPNFEDPTKVSKSTLFYEGSTIQP